MRIRLALFLVLVFSPSVCAVGIFQIRPSWVRPGESEPTRPTYTASPTETATPTSAPTPAPTATTDRSWENGRPLAARVNNQPIYLETYQKQVAELTETLAAQGVTLSPSGQESLAKTSRDVLEALIDQLIIEQQADKLGLVVSDEEVEAKLQEALGRRENGTALEEWLAANDLTIEELKGRLRAELITNRLFEYLTNNIPDTAEQVQVQSIRVTDEVTARLIVAQLKQGVDFNDLAQTYSVDEPIGDNDEQDWLTRGGGILPVEVETIAFSLQPAQMSGPISTPTGYYIIKLLNRQADRPLGSTMVQTLKIQAFDDWLTAERSAATIDRFVGW